MPRLPPRLIRHAARIDQHLPRLLHECRDLESAQNELRWMKQHVTKQITKINQGTKDPASQQNELKDYIRRRAKGEPLQYILGNQPFGELEILCEHGVLIPRPETELYTAQLAKVIEELKIARLIRNTDAGFERPLQVADFCTGSGCIALLLHSILQPKQKLKRDGLEATQTNGLTLFAYDVAANALNLCARNRSHNIRIGALHPSAYEDIWLRSANVLALGNAIQHQEARIAVEALFPKQFRLQQRYFDIIVSNPPYISPQQYRPGGPTTRSVRKYEPKLALVPPPPQIGTDSVGVEQADQFYAALFRIALATSTKVLVMEVGDNEQARRVLSLLHRLHSARLDQSQDSRPVSFEVWRDDGTQSQVPPSHTESKAVLSQSSDRAVVMWRGKWARWRRRAARTEP